MDKIIVYLDDADYACQHLAPMRAAAARNGTAPEPMHWVLVACAPRMTRRISKWVSNSARENWRAKWAEKVFALVVPQLAGTGDRVTTEVAKGPLPELSRKLMAEHGVNHVLDARRPKFGQDLQPVTENQPADQRGRWEVPGAVAGLGAVLMLAAE